MGLKVWSMWGPRFRGEGFKVCWFRAWSLMCKLRMLAGSVGLP